VLVKVARDKKKTTTAVAEMELIVGQKSVITKANLYRNV
jgi:ribosomal protein L5